MLPFFVVRFHFETISWRNPGATTNPLESARSNRHPSTEHVLVSSSWQQTATGNIYAITIWYVRSLLRFSVDVWTRNFNLPGWCLPFISLGLCHLTTMTTEDSFSQSSIGWPWRWGLTVFSIYRPPISRSAGWLNTNSIDTGGQLNLIASADWPVSTRTIIGHNFMCIAFSVPDIIGLFLPAREALVSFSFFLSDTDCAVPCCSISENVDPLRLGDIV